MEETTAREKEVLRSLLSMERGGMPINEVGRNQGQQQQQQQMQLRMYTQAPGEEPHNLSTSQQQQAQQQQQQQAQQQQQQQQQPAGQQPQLTLQGVETGEMAHHHQHQQHHPGPAHHAAEHQPHIQPQQGVYKSGTEAHETMHGHVQWMTPTPTSGHQVIILHAPPEQQHDSGGGMAGLIQAAEQGQLVGQQVWETHVSDYPAGVQLSDGTIIPAHGHHEFPQHGAQSMPHGQHQQGYVMVEAKPQEAAPEGSAAASAAPSTAKERKERQLKKKKKKLADMLADGIDPTKLEESAEEVRARFEKGCDCAEESCFKNLNADFVYRHRLNIAELSKHEHDMYLMGVTMACLANPEETARHKERKRLRAKYVFQGKEVCLDAFLYLENTTHYQLKRIRKHVITHGVTPRVHGNHGKRPHNTFPLDIYKYASKFLSDYLQKFNHKTDTKKKSQTKRPPLCLPQEVTRKKIHEAYVDFINQCEPDAKVMSYSAFRYFLKEQFAHVRFAKVEKSPPVPALAPLSGGDVVKEECGVAARSSIDLDENHRVVSTLLPSEADTSGVTFSVPEHHQTTTYTVTSRPYTAANGQLSYAGQQNYHYSIAM